MPNQQEIVQPDVHHDSIHETISRVIYQTTECSVPTLDLFQSTPLSRLICSGCFRKYNDKNAHPVDGESQHDLRYDIIVFLIHIQYIEYFPLLLLRMFINNLFIFQRRF